MRVGVYPETAVDIVDCEGVRRDFVMGLGCCWDAEEAELGA